MVSLNKVQLIGRLGKDPEILTLSNGKKLARFTLATSESFKNSSGEWIDGVEWHDITLWGKVAEWAGQKLAKGRIIYVEGKNRTNIYEDEQGNRKYKRYVEGYIVKPFEDKRNKTREIPIQDEQSETIYVGD